MARPTEEGTTAPPRRVPHRRRTVSIRPDRPRTGGTGNGGGYPPPSNPPGNPGGNGTGGGGAPANPYAAAQAAADRKEQQARKRASDKWLGLAASTQQQINSLRVALGKRGFKRALNQELRDVARTQRQEDRLLLGDYRERVGDLKETVENNEKEAAGKSNMALGNRSRERANAMSEVALQGAGETDLLRAQGMSLRNWEANQAETNRAFHDTLTSVNSALTDLTIDTRTGRFNNANDANTARNTLWTDYYGNRSEVFTNLGNAYGQQAEYYGLANEAIPSKKVKKKQRVASRRYGNAVRQSSLMTGKQWVNPGVRASIRNWEGRDPFEGDLNQDEYRNTKTEIAPKKPEGATLREWGK